jgi:uncharacterized membrane protein
MQSYSAFKVGFFVAIVVFIVSAVAVAWRAVCAGDDSAALGRSLQRPWLFAWLLMALSLASLPFSGWWLAHLGAWPLGQLWMLGAELLYVLVWAFWLLAVRRVNRLRRAQVYSRAADKKDVVAQRKRAFIYGGASALCFAVILVLVAVKPV